MEGGIINLVKDILVVPFWDSHSNGMLDPLITLVEVIDV